jgi:hypothetical protein
MPSFLPDAQDPGGEGTAGTGAFVAALAALRDARAVGGELGGAFTAARAELAALAVDVNVILMPPCIFCMQNHD